MSKITSRESLSNSFVSFLRKEIDNNKCRILICAGTGCIAGGSGAIYDKMCDLVASNPNIEVCFEPEVAHGDGDIAVKERLSWILQRWVL